MSIEQLSLCLFEPKSFEDIKIENNFNKITIEYNPRLKSGWRVRKSGFPARAILTIPTILSTAPDVVKLALLQWTALFLTASQKKFRQEKKVFEKTVWEFFTKAISPSDIRRPINAQRLQQQEQGTHFNLRDIFDRINTIYFNGTLVSYLRFGKPASLTSYQTNKFTKLGEATSIITIGGVYDSLEVPLYAIEGVMYHEMLHIAIPPEKRATRRLVHGKKFREAEKQFEFFKEWRIWEKENIRKLHKKQMRIIKAAL